MKDLEHQHQVAFFEIVSVKYMRKYPFLDKLLFAVPNGGHRSKAQAGKLKAEGVKSGVSDILLLAPSRGYNFLCIEMKQGKNKQSASQCEFEDRVYEYGKGYYYLAYSSELAIKCLDWYLSGRDIERV